MLQLSLGALSWSSRSGGDIRTGHLSRGSRNTTGKGDSDPLRDQIYFNSRRRGREESQARTRGMTSFARPYHVVLVFPPVTFVLLGHPETYISVLVVRLTLGGAVVHTRVGLLHQPWC